MKEDGGPAFPRPFSEEPIQNARGQGFGGGGGHTETAWTGALLTAVDPGYHEHPEGPMYPHDAQSGMSLRDWFAGQALSGLIVNPDTVSVYCPLSMRAYEIADAMLAERGKDA